MGLVTWEIRFSYPRRLWGTLELSEVETDMHGFEGNVYDNFFLDLKDLLKQFKCSSHESFYLSRKALKQKCCPGTRRENSRVSEEDKLPDPTVSGGFLLSCPIPSCLLQHLLFKLCFRQFVRPVWLFRHPSWRCFPGSFVWYCDKGIQQYPKQWLEKAYQSGSTQKHFTRKLVTKTHYLCKLHMQLL